jgi:hypothetical protein
VFNQVFMTLWMSVSSLGLVGWASMPLGAALGYLAKRILAGRSMDAAIAHH